MNWINLTTQDQLDRLKELSKQKTQVIFKHSTRCAISSMAKNRLEKTDAPSTVDFYYLDLIKYRNLSIKIAEEYAVSHESPQVLVIRNGECTYDDSHGGISMKDIIEQA